MARIVTAIAAVLAALSGAARAESRLLMLEEPGCMWCKRWNEEVGVIYHKTDEGRRAPLIRADIRDKLPEGMSLKSRAQFTPTFVLLQDGHEIGRLEGYPGEAFFWGMLGELLKGLPDADGTVLPTAVLAENAG